MASIYFFNRFVSRSCPNLFRTAETNSDKIVGGFSKYICESTALGIELGFWTTVSSIPCVTAGMMSLDGKINETSLNTWMNVMAVTSMIPMGLATISAPIVVIAPLYRTVNALRCSRLKILDVGMVEKWLRAK